jgi:hypothetical protein
VSARDEQHQMGKNKQSRLIVLGCAGSLLLVLGLVAACPPASNVQRLPIGAACNTSGQCGTGRFFCDTSRPNGYCKADCSRDADCPTGAICVGAGAVLAGACERACPNGVGDCRASEGYLCEPASSAASAAYCDKPPPIGDGGATD